MTANARILVVEDDVLIGMELSERLGEMGYAVLGPAETLAAADALLGELPDAALLDANLDGESTIALGARLHAAGVPVAFCTGYDHLRGLPPELAKTPILTKPIADEPLKAALAKMLAR